MKKKLESHRSRITPEERDAVWGRVRAELDGDARARSRWLRGWRIPAAAVGAAAVLVVALLSLERAREIPVDEVRFGEPTDGGLAPVPRDDAASRSAPPAGSAAEQEKDREQEASRESAARQAAPEAWASRKEVKEEPAGKDGERARGTDPTRDSDLDAGDVAADELEAGGPAEERSSVESLPREDAAGEGETRLRAWGALEQMSPDGPSPRAESGAGKMKAEERTGGDDREGAERPLGASPGEHAGAPGAYAFDALFPANEGAQRFDAGWTRRLRANPALDPSAHPVHQWVVSTQAGSAASIDRALDSGRLPDPRHVRIEELLALTDVSDRRETAGPRVEGVRSPFAAERVFVRVELPREPGLHAGVRFDPETVRRYRLVGFRADEEVAPPETGRMESTYLTHVALYEIWLVPGAEGRLLAVEVGDDSIDALADASDESPASTAARASAELVQSDLARDLQSASLELAGSVVTGILGEAMQQTFWVRALDPEALLTEAEALDARLGDASPELRRIVEWTRRAVPLLRRGTRPWTPASKPPDAVRPFYIPPHP